jgi:cell division protein FtsI/penicillin-binding protein 2
MTKAGNFRRPFVIAMLLIAAFAALGYRLVDLQVNRHAELRVLAQKNTRRLNIREPLRGQIRDIRGNPLALSLPAKRVCADPTLLGNHQERVARVLAPLLETNETYLVERLMPRTRIVDGKVKTNSYVVLKQKVALQTWEQVQGALTNLTFDVDETALKPSQRTALRNVRTKAVFAEEDQMRIYPNQTLAAHLVGYVGGDQQQGQNGIELALNSKLTGVRGWTRTETDVRRRELVVYRDQDVEPRHGYNVVLTVDSALQQIVETELAEGMAKHSPISISCTVVRPRTGEILAMATLPTYNPNRPGAFPPETLRNRVITDTAEPGSTFKIVVVSAALNEKLTSLTEVFDCENGRFAYGGRILHDHESYSDLTVEGIITKSSNIGSAKLGIRLGEQRLYDYIRGFGFGSRTGIPLPGEVNGTVWPTKKWYKVSLAQIPMGHGLTCTPLQTTMGMCAIANGGNLMRPTLVSRLEDEDGNILAQFQPQLVRQVVSERAARDMVQALKTVVLEGGTGTKARLENYTVAGKTGTAQKVENGAYVRKYFSSFIGFFPADYPELCISVVMDEPKNGSTYGGQTAGPVFKNIAEKAANYLNLRPDILPESAVTNAIAATDPLKEGRF